ncbi:hypothetical protein [Govanella unica]|uniref:Uncharacterized protein n=1 Tax=Govanella unica TaxID=2975056 RepID=A0A9X3Z665_9PROT|nr:hypothetical protein [Govania unica]MDA5192619.1 hypothetical protein [Govania unica]
MIQAMMIEDDQLQQTALRLMRCLGSRAARDYCLAQEWRSLYEQICVLEGRTAGQPTLAS